MTSKWTLAQMPEQIDKVAVVTGANSGIGFETAKALAQKGATVVLGCRNVARGYGAKEQILSEVNNAVLEVDVLDLSNLQSVKQFAQTVCQRHSKIDLCIANAGVMMTPNTKTADGFEMQLGTNHLGHFALIGLMLEALLKKRNSRIVIVASHAHRDGQVDLSDLHFESKPYNSWKAYAQSKLANLLFMYELQKRLLAKNKTTIAVAAHPGWTGTNLQKNMGIADFLNPFLAQCPAKGALPTLYAACANHVKGGDYIGPRGLLGLWGYPKRVDSSRRSKDMVVAEKLWEISETLTSVNYDALK